MNAFVIAKKKTTGYPAMAVFPSIAHMAYFDEFWKFGSRTAAFPS